MTPLELDLDMLQERHLFPQDCPQLGHGTCAPPFLEQVAAELRGKDLGDARGRSPRLNRGARDWRGGNGGGISRSFPNS